MKSLKAFRPRAGTHLVAAGSAVVLAHLIGAPPAMAATCQYEGTAPLPGGIQPPLLINASCTDPDFNENNFEIVEVKQNVTLPAPYAQIPFTQVKVRFRATMTIAELAAQGYTAGGPQTLDQPATFYFPPKELFQNRFFQHVYPLPQSTPVPNAPPGVLPGNITADINFSLQSGGFFIDSEPANPLVGYRVDAAFSKFAKSYAQQLYGKTGRIYGYIWGGSGGSYQVEGALEKTTGVWDGAVPFVIALSGLTSTGGMMSRLYEMRVPAAKRAQITAAVQPGSGRDIYAGLTSDEKAALEELLRFGVTKRVVATSGVILFDDGRAVDPTYEDDFWSLPGYAGKDAPPYVQQALVDQYATITGKTVNAQGQTVLTLDRAPTPSPTVGLSGLEHYVYLSDGTTRVRGANEASSVLAGTRNDAARTFTVSATNDPALVAALQVGAKLRINNRYYIAVAHYPRYTVPPKGMNIQYDEYRDAAGNPIYPQRPVDAARVADVRTSGGTIATGKINFKTIAVTNQLDTSTFHVTGAAYAKIVENAIGSTKTDEMFRLYHQDNADHFDNVTIENKSTPRLVPYVPELYQALRDLSGWVEKGITPPPSTRYVVADGQVILPEQAADRLGIQPVVHLTANGGDRAVVSVNQPVNLVGKIEVPPKTGKVVGWDWYLGGTPIAYEPSITLAPKVQATVARTVTFPNRGTYFVTLRARSERSGNANEQSTVLQNLACVRVVVQ